MPTAPSSLKPMPLPQKMPEAKATFNRASERAGAMSFTRGPPSQTGFGKRMTQKRVL